MPPRRHWLTSQTRDAVVVFPTPGGPDSRAALYPDPSSFPPNFPVFAVTIKKKNETIVFYFFYIYFLCHCWMLACVSTRGLHRSSTMVSVPVLQPAQQLVSTALLSLLTNHSLQRARPVLVHPQQSFPLPGLAGKLCLRGWRWRLGGGKAQFPASSRTRASSGWCPTLSGPGGVALAQAGLWWAGSVGRCGITFRGRNLLGFWGAFGGFAGSSGLWAFALNK